METNTTLVMSAFNAINLKKLIKDDNLKLSKIVVEVNKYFKNQGSSYEIGPGNYDILQKMIRQHFGYIMLKGQNKKLNWKPSNEPVIPFLPELYRTSNAKKKNPKKLMIIRRLLKQKKLLMMLLLMI